MPDIRQNPTVLDDFERTPSDPASGNWGDTIFFGHMAIDGAPGSRILTHGASQSPAIGYWTAATYDGDDAEAWGLAVGGGEINGIAYAVGLFKDFGGSIDGYRFRWESVGDVYTLRRYTNGGFSVIDTGNPDVGSSEHYMLLRRNGTSVEGWVSGNADPTTWTMVVSAVDNTHTTGLYACLGVTDNAQTQQLGWDEFGAGPETEVQRTQHYRVLEGVRPYVA
jgi:hypothetical protein